MPYRYISTTNDQLERCVQKRLTIRQAACEKAIKEQLDLHPNLAELEDNSYQDEQSTAAVSSTGTPRPSGPSQTKLKLTFTANGRASNGVTTNGTNSGVVSDED